MSTQFVLHDDSAAPTLRIDYGKELNQEQLAVVLGGDGPCLVLAGAGSGKTRTITYRVAYLLERGVDPSSILLLTFTNKSAREMLERVERLLGASAHGIWGGTFHSVANRLLRMFGRELGYAPGFSILDTDDTKDLIKAVLKDMRIDPKERRFPSPSVCLDIISYTRNVCGSVAETLEVKHSSFAQLEPELEELSRRYGERKRLANAMDFDDLLANMLQLLEHPTLGPHIAGQFRYVLVDEYQDTNAVQARLVKQFASAHGNVLVVGDDAQSIYAFRGADVRNILTFPDTFPGAKTFTLLTNYRSTPEILEIANTSLRHNVDQFAKDLTGVKQHGTKPALIPCASARQEAQYVAEQILVLRQRGTALANIAVLFRASSQSQQLELELLKRDVPYEYRGGQKFFERAHIKDVLSFLRIAVNPRDEPAWLRVLGLQNGIGATTASTIADRARGYGALPEAIDSDMSFALSPKARAGWEEFCDVSRAMMRAHPGPAEMIRSLAQSSYQDLLEREYPNWRERLEDIEQFALFAEGYTELATFLADVTLYDDVVAKREEASRGADEERMVLSTIHQAKGLEWDSVFVIHLADGSFPNRRALGEDGGLEEERRLFYVAVTRARRHLFLSYPLTMGYDALTLNRPSVFLDELHPGLLERIELVSAGRAWRGRDDDAFAEEETIEIDAIGEARPASLRGPRTGFLRSIDEL